MKYKVIEQEKIRVFHSHESDTAAAAAAAV